MVLGILVVGDNHFIVEGPKPDAAQAQSLTRQWTLIEIGNTRPPIPGWEIRNKAFREDLEWAVIVTVPGQQASPAVEQLLSEMAARGILAESYKSMGSAETGLP